jgi:hypothetical protein
MRWWIANRKTQSAGMQLACGISADKNGPKPGNTSGKFNLLISSLRLLTVYTPIVKHPLWTLASDLHGLPLDIRSPLKESTTTQ